ncbi:1300_t:CDS:1, partial [Racocetra fulgida]
NTLSVQKTNFQNDLFLDQENDFEQQDNECNIPLVQEINFQNNLFLYQDNENNILSVQEINF